VADADSARGLVEGVVREMGGIDVLVNNAAVFEAHPVPGSTPGASKTPSPRRSRRTLSVRRTCPSWPSGL
jgi:NAD(P)-dependent dehydrogenase (short-subunit alcohol dehydrogenase family)